MPTIYDCDPGQLVEKTSLELKKISKIKAPEWAAFVKTGVHKERPPVSGDWWHTRAASVLRQIYRHGPVGVSKLRAKYGGKKNRGYKTEHFYKGSGNILRKVLQQLEAAGFVRKEDKGIYKGRIITAEGKKFLDGIASQLAAPVQRKIAEPKEAEKAGQKEKVKKEHSAKDTKPEVKKAETSKEKQHPKTEKKGTEE